MAYLLKLLLNTVVFISSKKVSGKINWMQGFSFILVQIVDSVLMIVCTMENKVTSYKQSKQLSAENKEKIGKNSTVI